MVDFEKIQRDAFIRNAPRSELIEEFGRLYEYIETWKKAVEATERHRKALELRCDKLEDYADHLRNCRHKSGDPFVKLHECTCGLRELYEGAKL